MRVCLPVAIFLSCAAGPSGMTLLTCRNSSGSSPPMIVKPNPMLLLCRAVDRKLPFSCVGSRVNRGFSAGAKRWATNHKNHNRALPTEDVPKRVLVSHSKPIKKQQTTSRWGIVGMRPSALLAAKHTRAERDTMACFFFAQTSCLTCSNVILNGV